MRRHHLVAVSALAALVPAGAAVATAPPDTEPVATSGDSAGGDTATATAPAPASSDMDMGSEPAGEPSAPASAATVFDDEGNEVASITVGAIEPGWVDYDPDNTPDEGREYLRVTVTVTSMVSDGSFGVAIDDFVLQDAYGFLDTADNVATAAQAESDEDIVEDADLANGESVELALTFEVDPAVGGQSVFYHPDDDRLVDVAEVA